MIDIIGNIPRGVIEGLAVTAIVFVIRLLYKKSLDFLILNKYKGIIGNYFIYCKSTSGNGDVTKINVNIKSRFGKLIAFAKTAEFKFKGSVTINDLHIYINLKGLGHPEEAFYIFHTPLHKSIHKLWGTISGISVLREPCVAICVLSDKELDLENVKAEINDFPETGQKGLLKVPIDEKIYLQNRFEK